MRIFSKVAIAALGIAAFSMPAAAQDLTGAGASFPDPLYKKWFDEYARLKGVQINYQSIGSSGGIRQISEQTVDFGASDAPMSDEELARAKGGALLHIPMTLGAVVISYNLPELKKPLRLDGPVLAEIFLGKITRWNDSRIAALNAGAKLPSTDILVVHRSDGSGTTYVFTDYLAAVSPEWATRPGKGKDLAWPVGLGGKGNDGVAGQVKQIPGAIGYIELAYARQNKLAYADMKNSSGMFVTPSIEAVTAAAAAAHSKFPPNTDYRVSIVNQAGKDVYPIASFTFLLVYQHQKDAAKGKKLLDVVKWALTDGQKYAGALDYAPIPESMSKDLIKRLSIVTVASM